MGTLTTLEAAVRGAGAWQVIVAVSVAVFFTVTGLVALFPPENKNLGVLARVLIGISALVAAAACIIDLFQ